MNEDRVRRAVLEETLLAPLRMADLPDPVREGLETLVVNATNIALVTACAEVLGIATEDGDTPPARSDHDL